MQNNFSFSLHIHSFLSFISFTLGFFLYRSSIYHQWNSFVTFRLNECGRSIERQLSRLMHIYSTYCWNVMHWIVHMSISLSKLQHFSLQCVRLSFFDSVSQFHSLQGAKLNILHTYYMYIFSFSVKWEIIWDGCEPAQLKKNKTEYKSNWQPLFSSSDELNCHVSIFYLKTIYESKIGVYNSNHFYFNHLYMSINYL